MPPPSSVHDIKILVSSFHPLIVIETTEEERISAILRSAASELRISLFDWSITRGLCRRDPHGEQPRKIAQTEKPLGALRHIEGMTLEAIYLLKDFSGFLQDPSVARQMRELTQLFTRTRSAVILTEPSVSLPEDLQHLAVYYDLALPDETELRKLLKTMITSLSNDGRVCVEVTPEEGEQIIEALRGMTLNEARQAIAHAALLDGKLDVSDIDSILDRKAQLLRDGGLLEYFPAADNRYELAGFQRLRGWLERAHMGFSSEAKELNLTPPKGVLMVGVQGCGKSLAAKVIAREWRLPLVKLDAGSLYDKYFGESERKLRKALSQAEAIAPAVLWIDEIEKGWAPAGQGGEDGGLSRRMLGYLLTWLQEKRQDVFVVATANDVKVLPPELLRKGRFDEIFFVDLPSAAERKEIFRIHLTLRTQDPADFNLDELVVATQGFNGAEIEQATIASLYRALHKKEPLSTAHMLKEIRETVPLSVSRREDIQQLRAMARERFVPVS